MHRSSIKWILTALGIPAGLLAATAAPTVAASTARSDPAVPLWRPPMPCVAMRAGVLSAGGGFCPGTTGGLDWNDIGVVADGQTEPATIVPPIIWEGIPQPITVELLTPTDYSTDSATIGLDLTLSGELADQLATADQPRLVVWITMATPAPAQPPAPAAESVECPITPGSDDDFVPGSRRMPRC